MFCTKCGMKNSDSSNFCVSCGNRLENFQWKQEKVANDFQAVAVEKTQVEPLVQESPQVAPSPIKEAPPVSYSNPNPVEQVVEPTVVNNAKVSENTNVTEKPVEYPRVYQGQTQQVGQIKPQHQSPYPQYQNSYSKQPNYQFNNKSVRISKKDFLDNDADLKLRKRNATIAKVAVAVGGILVLVALAIACYWDYHASTFGFHNNWWKWVEFNKLGWVLFFVLSVIIVLIINIAVNIYAKRVNKEIDSEYAMCLYYGKSKYNVSSNSGYSGTNWICPECGLSCNNSINICGNCGTRRF